jgi:hypothetical protein
MKELTKLDKILLILGFLIVIAIFTLAFVMYFKGGTCLANPCKYAISKNISCFQQVILP